MASTTINVRTDSEVKAKAQEVLSALGLDFTTAINLFLRQVICKQSVSFDVSIAPLDTTARLGGREEKTSVKDGFKALPDSLKEYSSDADDAVLKRLKRLDRFYEAVESIVDEPFDEDFDKIIDQGISMTGGLDI